MQFLKENQNSTLIIDIVVGRLKFDYRGCGTNLLMGDTGYKLIQLWGRVTSKI